MREEEAYLGAFLVCVFAHSSRALLTRRRCTYILKNSSPPPIAIVVPCRTSLVLLILVSRAVVNVLLAKLEEGALTSPLFPTSHRHCCPPLDILGVTNPCVPVKVLPEHTWVKLAGLPAWEIGHCKRALGKA
jgi:hypothetical protein